MNFPRISLADMPIEDRIEKYARIVLVALLFAALGSII
jgi:hypothetical protein